MTNHLLYYSCRHKAETGTICWHNKNHGFIFLITNIPLFAMSRTIERNLLEMIGEKDIPINWKPENEILM